jgi:hypothetical protein
VRVGIREKIAAAGDVNAHYVSDSAFILQNGTPEMIQQLHDGALNIQEALRLCGRVTQRDRHRAKLQQTLDLCDAVLNDDDGRAKQIAAQIVISRDKYQRSKQQSKWATR